MPRVLTPAEAARLRGTGGASSPDGKPPPIPAVRERRLTQRMMQEMADMAAEHTRKAMEPLQREIAELKRKLAEYEAGDIDLCHRVGSGQDITASYRQHGSRVSLSIERGTEHGSTTDAIAGTPEAAALLARFNAMAPSGAE